MSGITITPDSGTEFTANAAEWNSVCRLDDNNYAVAYRDNNDGNKGKINVGSRTGTSVTISELDKVVFNNDATDLIQVRALSSTLVAITYRDINSISAYVICCSISGTTITVGTPVLVSASNADGLFVAPLDATDFVVGRSYNGAGITCYVGSVSGTTITLGSAQTVASTSWYSLNGIGLDGTHFVMVAFNTASGLYLTGASVNIGAKTITFGGSSSLLENYNVRGIIDIFDSQHFVVGTYDASFLRMRASSINLSTLVISVGAELASTTNNIASLSSSVCCVTANNFIISYYTTTGTQAELQSGTLTGSTTIAWDAQGPQILDNTTTAYTSICRLTNDYFIVGYKEG